MIFRVKFRDGLRYAPALLLLLLLAVPACRVSIDEEEISLVTGDSSGVFCVYPPPENVYRNGAFSLGFSGGTYWIFSETIIESTPGRYTFLSSSAAVAGQAPVTCSGELVDVVGPDGTLTQIIPLTADEEAFNAEHPEGPRIAIWPISGFVHRDLGYVYYRKVLMNDYFDLTVLGVGVAQIGYGETATRPVVNRFEGEPTLVWVDPQADWGSGVFLDEDGYAYVYGCFPRSSWDNACRVARVDPEEASDPEAYAYFDGDSWSPFIGNAAEVFEGPGRVSVSYHRRLGRYLAVYSTIFSNLIEIRTAEHPWGPFTEALPLFEVEETGDWGITDLFLHPAYESEDGRTVFLSYYADPEGGRAGMRMIRLRFR